MQGRAFAGPGRGATNEFVFCTRDRMDERYDMMRSVADRRWNYIRNFRPDLAYVQPLEYMFQARGYQSWARVAAEGKLTAPTAQFWGSKPSEELYDSQADPDNVKNLAADPAHRETLERFRAALKQHTLAINDNGFIPEGSPMEGYEASRKSGAYPLEKVFALAVAASERDVKNLPRFIAALAAASEPLRWWAAQGCTMLGTNAASAEAALRRSLDDPSGAVQVSAAEALAGLGKTELALPVLERALKNTDAPFFALQAANVLDRLGERARPSLGMMKEILVALAKASAPADPRYYGRRIMERNIAVLEGREPALVYPATGPE
jgi:hypothetical protein